jgi:hypothetical protein
MEFPSPHSHSLKLGYTTLYPCLLKDDYMVKQFDAGHDLCKS